jgi:hypothetical protein
MTLAVGLIIGSRVTGDNHRNCEAPNPNHYPLVPPVVEVSLPLPPLPMLQLQWEAPRGLHNV